MTTRGRIAALLELGAGFHPELTGRENVYLNASILGLTKKETDRHFDAIVAFAELEDFIDQQVKYYSSGMFVRLGFAVAVHVDPQILLVDEVLAVGDEGFQRKCIERVKQFQAEGRTIVFVTHAVDLVRRICDEAIMLDHGEVRASGDVDSVISELRTVLLQQHAYYAGEEGTRDLEIVSRRGLRRPGPHRRGLPSRRHRRRPGRPEGEHAASRTRSSRSASPTATTSSSSGRTPTGASSGGRSSRASSGSSSC